MIARERLALLILLSAALPAAAAQWPPVVGVCWDYGCDRHARVLVPPADWRAIRDLLSPPAADAAAERRRVALAVARLERIAGRATGTHRDRYENIAGAGLSGQMDCIDESRNTAGYLRLLAEHGLLRWHRPGGRAQRMRWVLDQHWTAVLVERGSERRWAIDSWFLDNGHRPYVQRLDAWREAAMDAVEHAMDLYEEQFG